MNIASAILLYFSSVSASMSLSKVSFDKSWVDII